jgi:hypothetical protein
MPFDYLEFICAEALLDGPTEFICGCGEGEAPAEPRENCASLRISYAFAAQRELRPPEKCYPVSS